MYGLNSIRSVSVKVETGSNMGGYEGFSLTEEYLTNVSNITGVAVMCAAGNESQARHLAAGRLAGNGETQNVELSVKNQSEDIYLTIWNCAPSCLAVSVKSPTG